MSLFTGAGVAIITPMKENGDVNYEKFAEIIEDQIAGGMLLMLALSMSIRECRLLPEQVLTVRRQQSTSQQRLRSWALTDCL